MCAPAARTLQHLLIQECGLALKLDHYPVDERGARQAESGLMGIFSPEAIDHAMRYAITTADLPPGKKGALVVMGDAHGVTAVFAAKINDVWEAQAEVEWHGGVPSGGAVIKASW